MPQDRPSRYLTKYETNDLFKALEASSVSISEFDLVDEYAIVRPLGARMAVDVTVVHHRRTGSMFAILTSPSRWVPCRTQQQIGHRETSILDHWVVGKEQRTHQWEDVVSEIQQWAENVAAKIKYDEEYRRTPDFWEGVYRTNSHSRQYAQRYENAPFDNVEQDQISEQIKQIKVYIKTTHELTIEQISKIETRLDHAEEASRRMGRKDWLLLFYGAISSTAFSDLVPQQTVQHVMMIVIQGLGHLFGMGGPPQLPPSG